MPPFHMAFQRGCCETVAFVLYQYVQYIYNIKINKFIHNLIELNMEEDFREGRGFKKFRVVSGTTIMVQEPRKAQQAKVREAKRIAKLQECQAKKFAGMDSLFPNF